MFARIITLLAGLAATGWYVQGQQRAGHLERVDDAFLDFLVANARERLSQPEPASEVPVAFVQLRREDAGEYAAWPPPPLDWQTILKSLRAYDPEVIVIPTPLTWGRPAPDFVPAVAEALLPFPSAILGIDAELADAKRDTPAFLGDLGDMLPKFRKVDGDPSSAPRLATLITAPDRILSNQAEVGLSIARPGKSSWLLPYAVREGGNLIPSVLAQTMARHSRTPYSLQRIRLGVGGGAYLSGGLYVPLLPSGEWAVETDHAPPTVNALHLMTGTLADGTDAADRAALGKGKIIVVGLDHETDDGNPRLSRLYAQALAQILTLPRLRLLSPISQWLSWFAAGCASLWIVVRVRKSRALIAGLWWIFAALLVSFVLFQSNLMWFPPTMPAALVLTGAVIGALFGRREIESVAKPETPSQT
jgi:hypothetical protein